MDPADQTNDLLKSLVELTSKNTETLNRMLAVARFGPNAGAAGGTPQTTKTPKTPAELAQERFDARQTWMRERGSALQQIGLTSAGSAYHRASSMAEGFQGLGMGRAAGLAQRAALPMAVVSAGIQGTERVSHAYNIANNPWATRDLKARQLFREFVPGGQTLQKIFDDFSGRSIDMQRVEQAHRERSADLSARLETSAFMSDWQPTQVGRQALSDAYRDQQVTGKAAGTFHPVMDRSSAKGEVAFQNEMKLIPMRKELLRTERELARASAERKQHETISTSLAEKQKSLESQRAGVWKEIERRKTQGGGSGAEYQEWLRRHERITEEIKGVSGQRRTVEQNAAAARANEAQAKGEVAKAKTRLEFMGKAEIKQGEADRSMSTARTLGDMDPIQRQQGMNILKMLQQGANPDLIPADMKALARQVAPAEYDRIITRHGAGTETFQAGRQAGLVGFEGDPFELQRQADELRRKAGEGEFKAEGQTAQEVAKAGEKLGAFISARITEFADAVKREIENQLRLGQNQ